MAAITNNNALQIQIHALFFESVQKTVKTLIETNGSDQCLNGEALVPILEAAKARTFLIAIHSREFFLEANKVARAANPQIIAQRQQRNQSAQERQETDRAIKLLEECNQMEQELSTLKTWENDADFCNSLISTCIATLLHLTGTEPADSKSGS